jgi:NAD(P)-dependent dehydrogenase (short-subunit alcohol dehydrogenase family)
LEALLKMSTFKFETTSDDAAEALKGYIQGRTGRSIHPAIKLQLLTCAVLITGTSPKSLGADASRAIASKGPSLLIIAGRSHHLLEETKAAITHGTPDANIRILNMDLGSQEPVRKAAAEVNSFDENIDILINCAGIMCPPYRKTPEGIESQFGINHVGHFLFTYLIMPKINRDGRIINVTSAGYVLSGVRYEDYNFEVRLASDRALPP